MFKAALAEERLTMGTVRALCFEGVPDGLHAPYWKARPRRAGRRGHGSDG